MFRSGFVEAVLILARNWPASIKGIIHRNGSFLAKRPKRARDGKIVQMSAQIMRQEAQRRGAMVREYLLSGYKLNCIQ